MSAQNNFYKEKPFAQEVSWQPLNQSRHSISNMVLKSMEGNLEFHLSMFYKLFYSTLIILGSLFILHATYSLLSYDFQATIISSALGYTFLGFGLYVFSRQDVPLVFNKKKNLYFKKTKEIEAKEKTLLNEIRAVQLLSHNNQAELNLVLENGRRIYVCSYDESAYEQIQNDANTIAEYISKPIWNGLKNSY